MEKKIILFVALFMIAVFSFADTYKILYINSTNIKINGKTAVVGLVFSDKDKITWTSEQQAIKVINLTSKRVVVLVAKALNKKGSISIYEYLTSKKHLSTRNFKSGRTLEEWQIDSTLYLLDTIYISRPQIGSNKIVAKAIDEEGSVIEIPISKDAKHYIITKDIYRGETPRSKRIDIKEYDKDRNWEYTVYSQLIIEPINRKL